MRVVVVGATGNVGTSLVRVLAGEPAVESVRGLARRIPRLQVAKTEWHSADIERDDLVPLFRGSDAVVHLAWLIQPSRDVDMLWRTNVYGSDRVFRAVVDAGVGVLVYASSVGAYSRGPKDRRVDERWPTTGIPTSVYSRHKADVERRLDRFEHEHRNVRVVRLRPGLIFKREAAAGIRRLFAGPLLPASLVRPGRLPLVPDIPGLRFQAVYSFDVADAYRLALLHDVHGAFNIAAEPVLDPPTLARLLGTRLVRIRPQVARALMSASWRLHLQPTPAGWLDLGLGVPLLDVSRARAELGWEPKLGADAALRDLLEGMSRGTGVETPPLSPKTSGPFRVREFVTGVGRTSGT